MCITAVHVPPGTREYESEQLVLPPPSKPKLVVTGRGNGWLHSALLPARRYSYFATHEEGRAIPNPVEWLKTMYEFVRSYTISLLHRIRRTKRWYRATAESSDNFIVARGGRASLQVVPCWWFELVTMQSNLCR